jgi:hypothetical protein
MTLAVEDHNTVVVYALRLLARIFNANLISHESQTDARICFKSGAAKHCRRVQRWKYAPGEFNSVLDGVANVASLLPNWLGEEPNPSVLC